MECLGFHADAVVAIGGGAENGAGGDGFGFGGGIEKDHTALNRADGAAHHFFGGTALGEVVEVVGLCVGFGAGLDGVVEGAVGGFEVEFDLDGGKAEGFVDVVETVDGAIHRQQVFEPGFHAEQIADGVLIFAAGESADHASTVAIHFPFRGGEQGTVEPIGDELRLRFGRAGFLFRRHLAGVDGIEHFHPGIEGVGVVDGEGEFVEGETTLFRTIAVAVVAVVFEKGEDGFLIGFLGDGRRGGDRADAEDAGGDDVSNNFHVFSICPVRVLGLS